MNSKKSFIIYTSPNLVISYVLFNIYWFSSPENGTIGCLVRTVWKKIDENVYVPAPYEIQCRA